MSKKLFRPLAFIRKALDELDIAEIERLRTDEVALHALAKDLAGKVDDMFPIPGKLGSLVDASNLDRVLFEVIVFVILKELLDDDAEEG